MSMQSANPVKEIDVACAGAMRESIVELAHAFTLTSGIDVSLKFDRSGAVKDRVLGGEVIDIVITTQAAVAELAQRHRIVPQSIEIVTHSRVGVAVKAGAARPDLGSAAAFCQMLLDAKSIACADPATGSPSGNHFVSLLRRLGIVAQVEPKLRLVGAGEGSVVVVCQAVADGHADIGIQQIAEILPVPGVDLAGPLPAELQQVTVFSAAVAASARQPELARRFIAFITSAAAAPVIMAHGMEPPPS